MSDVRSSFFSFCGLLTLGVVLTAFPSHAGERIPIGVIQGVVSEEADALRHRSPLKGKEVILRGVVHARLSWRGGKDKLRYWGYAIQDLPAEADGDPLTSDGIFVYAGLQPQLRWQGQGDVALEAGDVVTLKGKVQERYGQTELTELRVLKRKAGGDLDLLLPAVELKLDEDVAETQRSLERVEGMRVSLSAGAVTVSGSHSDERNRERNVWVIPEGHEVLSRAPEAALLYRGKLPLNTLPASRKLAGYGNRILVASQQLNAQDLNFPSLSAGCRFEGELRGVLTYGYREYRLQIDTMPAFQPAPSRNVDLPRGEGQELLHLVSYNIENLYDAVNDPYDDNDAHRDPGRGGVRRPFTYLPPHQKRFEQRIQKLATQLLEDLQAPDLMMLQEIEDQDVARFTEAGLVYGKEDDADGELDALQALVIQIVAAGGPVYGIAWDRDAADVRGIVCAFLYRSDRFRPLDPTQHAGLLGAKPSLSKEWEWLPLCQDVQNPKAFNARFTGKPDGTEVLGVFARSLQVFGLEDLRNGKRIWLLNNHFSSGPTRRVERRRAQAGLNAELVRSLEQQYPEDLIVVGGDLNVFPRPDDPHSPPSDQLGPLYQAGLKNLVDVLFRTEPERCFSYIYRGQVNILDHLFLNDPGMKAYQAARYLNLNSTEANAFADEALLRVSDHDPLWLELRW